MMQTFRLSDALWCILLNAPRGPNLACPRKSLSSARRFHNAILWKDALAQRRDRVTLVWWDQMRLAGLVSAQARAGRRVWEVDRLYLPRKHAPSQTNGHGESDPWEGAGLELLELLMQASGRHQAERILLRLPLNSPVFQLARRAGFFPYFQETLLEGYAVPRTPDKARPPVELERRLPEDDYALFQLFSAATPQPVRAGLGLTCDQWRDAQEPFRAGRREWVIRPNGKITGWLNLRCHRQRVEGELLVHPDHPELLSVLVDRSLDHAGLQRWLVPDYQESVRRTLLHHGFYEVAQYTMLIKTVAAPVMSHGMAPVEA